MTGCDTPDLEFSIEWLTYDESLQLTDIGSAVQYDADVGHVGALCGVVLKAHDDIITAERQLYDGLLYPLTVNSYFLTIVCP